MNQSLPQEFGKLSLQQTIYIRSYVLAIAIRCLHDSDQTHFNLTGSSTSFSDKHYLPHLLARGHGWRGQLPFSAS